MVLNETQRQAILLAAINDAELYAEAVRMQALGASMDEQDDAFATADEHYRKLVAFLAVADPLGTRGEPGEPVVRIKQSPIDSGRKKIVKRDGVDGGPETGLARRSRRVGPMLSEADRDTHDRAPY